MYIVFNRLSSFLPAIAKENEMLKNMNPLDINIENVDSSKDNESAGQVIEMVRTVELHST